MAEMDPKKIKPFCTDGITHPGHSAPGLGSGNDMLALVPLEYTKGEEAWPHKPCARLCPELSADANLTPPGLTYPGNWTHRDSPCKTRKPRHVGLTWVKGQLADPQASTNDGLGPGSSLG